ncbi:hypothetical protein DFQ05_0135 [Winogradskyella wandonensis]|uniref:Cadherin domain-containing protein n=1 Tax=Winogradskyella wandonensis TaxID=1442586 RepID=A0A4R1KV77_9FLAO|nr:hypothetical protein [Winogradskyella wandonensis]TCK68627.1 hypothetical protein DFQ05_0135 [Winogradskyella wandonensis]
MKSYLKSLVVTCFALLLFASCQDEAVQIINPTDQEAIVPNSALSHLMLRTSANATSEDNFLDNSDCFSVELPVTVIIGNITITIEDEEGLDELEELLENFEGEIPEFVFPITLISGDYSENVIENQEQLDNLIENCLDDSDEIECVDFVYPISFSVLNTQFVLIDTVTINSNEELYDFLDDLEEGGANIVALNFPVTLEYADGETITVNSNEELSNAIEAVDDDCDDDDFINCDVAEVKEALKECKWKLDDEFNDFDGLTVTFNDDFTLEITGQDFTEVITGNWTVTETDNGTYLVLSELSALQDDLGGEWLITDCDDDDIDIVKGDLEIDLDRICETDLDCNAESLSDELVECYWFAGSDLIDGLDNKFVFTENGTIKVYSNNEFIEIGVWNVGVEGNTLTLVLDFTGDYQSLSGVWEVVACHEGFFGLEKDGNILHLEQECFDENPFDCYPEEGVELVKCDENNDGFAVFNIYEAVPSCDNSGAPVTISFHTTSEGAENDADYLEGATAYTNLSNPQTVYVKVALFNNPEEKLIYPVKLIVEDCNPNPFECFSSFDAVMELCDEGNDGFEVFNLTIAYANCTPFADVVTYHVSLTDADADVNAIANPESYVNLTAPQTIYVRVEVGDAYEVFELLLKLEDCTPPGACTEEDVDGILMTCKWKITELNGDDNLITYRLDFNEGQELVVTNTGNSDTIIGTWSTSTNNNGGVDVLFDGINGADIQAISGNWTIVECTAEQLIFHKDSDQMTLDKICE